MVILSVLAPLIHCRSRFFFAGITQARGCGCLQSFVYGRAFKHGEKEEKPF